MTERKDAAKQKPAGEEMHEAKVAETPEEELTPVAPEGRDKRLDAWIPKTELGRKVKNGEITSIDEILSSNQPILEPEIVDILLQLEEKVVEFRKTTRVVRAGRRFSFAATVLVGNRNGYVGIGTAKDNEKWPAVRKATNNAKLNLVRVARGCGSWECNCNMQHSVPFKVEGKSASVRITLLPAPRGVGLVVGETAKDVLRFAGITDVWSKTKGSTDTRLNYIHATVDALAKTSKIKASDSMLRKLERTAK